MKLSSAAVILLSYPSSRTNRSWRPTWLLPELLTVLAKTCSTPCSRWVPPPSSAFSFRTLSTQCREKQQRSAFRLEFERRTAACWDEFEGHPSGRKAERLMSFAAFGVTQSHAFTPHVRNSSENWSFPLAECVAQRRFFNDLRQRTERGTNDSRQRPCWVRWMTATAFIFPWIFMNAPS